VAVAAIKPETIPARHSGRRVEALVSRAAEVVVSVEVLGLMVVVMAVFLSGSRPHGATCLPLLPNDVRQNRQHRGRNFEIFFRRRFRSI
jgi:hypothetical protein